MSAQQNQLNDMGDSDFNELLKYYSGNTVSEI